tara:strand:+ start:962 stop:1435 length:474 start_codon:yes stop_codon:yes gene_type:complete
MIENTFTENERIQENKQIHSKMGKTWFFDLDGTLLKSTSNEKLDQMISKHGKTSHRQEEVLMSSKQFLKNIPKSDQVVLTTARANRHRDHTVRVLEYVGIKYDQIIFDIPAGARILVNDIKPRGAVKNNHEIKTAFAINLKRNEGLRKEHLDEYLRV